jgi:hypothetical protein
MRAAAGLSLEDIADRTKISPQILRSLESGDFRFLPQKVFCRNFVSQYAEIVGADPKRVTAAFDAAWDRFLLASGSFPSLTVDEPPLVRTVRWRFWGPVAAAAVIALLAALVIWRGSLHEEGYPGPGRESSSSRRIGDPSLGEPAPRLPTPSPVVAAEAVSPEPEEVAITIRVRPERECWVHYRDHNGVAGGKLLAGGAEERIVLVGPIKLTIGDAGAASLEVAGRVYGDLGRPGQVVHTEVSADGLVVLGRGRAGD